jgi:hypothetical protein
MTQFWSKGVRLDRKLFFGRPFLQERSSIESDPFGSDPFIREAFLRMRQRPANATENNGSAAGIGTKATASGSTEKLVFV